MPSNDHQLEVFLYYKQGVCKWLCGTFFSACKGPPNMAHFSLSRILTCRGPQRNLLSPRCLCCPNRPPVHRLRPIHFSVQSMPRSDSMFNQRPESGTFLLQEQVAFRAEFRKSSPCDYACSTDSSVFTLALICHPHKLTQARRSRQHPAKVAPRGP